MASQGADITLFAAPKCWIGIPVSDSRSAVGLSVQQDRDLRLEVMGVEWGSSVGAAIVIGEKARVKEEEQGMEGFARRHRH
jgi:hypothetical protein